MRYENFTADAYYQVHGKGIGQEKLFIDDEDYVRFIFLITHFQSPIRVYNVSWYTKSFLKNGSFSTKADRADLLLKDRHIRLVSFALMPDYFDILVQNLEDQILSVYMHRVLTAYGKYFNAKYKKRGHIFAGPFEAVFVNPKDLSAVSTGLHQKPADYRKYRWSSYSDYTTKNRWGGLLTGPKYPQK